MKKLFLNQRDAALIEKVNHEVEELFDPDILSDGYDDFEDEAVVSLDVDDQWNIEADVEDSHYVYDVKLNLHDLQAAACNCDYDYCEHIAAVLFAVYKSYGLRASLLLPDDQQQASNRTLAMPTIGGKPLPQLTPVESDNAEEWHRFFERKMGARYTALPNAIGGVEQQVKRLLLPFARTWQPVNRGFYAIHVEFYIIKVMEQSHRQAASTYYYHHYTASYGKLADQSLLRIVDSAKGLQSEELRLSHAERFQNTIHYVRGQTFREEHSVFNWLDLYRMLWWGLFQHGSWLEAETKRLHELLDRAGAGQKRYDLISALAHVDVIAGRDQQAMEILSTRLPKVHPDLYLIYPTQFQKAKDESRTLAWLRWLRPYAKDNRSEYWESYLKLWEKASLSTISDEFEQVIRELLPRSLPYYGQYLLKQEAYQKWVELQMLCDVDPMYMESGELRHVADKAPEVLLPYFHQAVDLCIAQKNREAYVWAVKLLKSLHRFYRKLRRDEDWSRFILHLTSRYSRLRALQEELKKGKLLS